MTRDLSRLFNPRTLAVIGGGAWNKAVVQQAQKFGFSGDIWPVHPARDSIAGLPAFRGVSDLPNAPDATFIGINRDATIGAAERLARVGAGGAVCFASGFTEAMAEDATGANAQARLLKAAGDMPVLGPNCYGFINALDGAIIWPDQHGMSRVESGVAILTQSSNIAINLTFQQRGLPIAMMIACGNMAQISQAAIIDALLDDPRITAIGLHIEGFTDLAGWESAAHKAHAKGIPIIALKAGRSAAAKAATVSHTASLAGEDAGADALFSFLGIGRVNTLPELLETLKLAHVHGPMASTHVASISCSGGEASLSADLAHAHGISFPPLSEAQQANLRNNLGPKVALANPLDYHTYIWRDAETMAQAWAAMAAPDISLTMSIVDIPDAARADPADWDCAIDAIIGASQETGAPFAMVATLPETMPLDTANMLMANGIAPLQGLSEAMVAVKALVQHPPQTGLFTAQVFDSVRSIGEREAKDALALVGIDVPKHVMVGQDIHGLQFPVAVKASGIAHKMDAGAVALNLHTPDAVNIALRDMKKNLPGARCFIEEMITDGVVELLVAFTNDPAHGIMLTLGAGGTLTELWEDTQHLMLPVSAQQIDDALSRLRIAPIIDGYRGKPAADRTVIAKVVLGLQDFVRTHLHGFVELEINPLICTPNDAVVADALWQQSYEKGQT